MISRNDNLPGVVIVVNGCAVVVTNGAGVVTAVGMVFAVETTGVTAVVTDGCIVAANINKCTLLSIKYLNLVFYLKNVQQSRTKCSLQIALTDISFTDLF